MCVHAFTCGDQRTACRVILLCGFRGEDAACWTWWQAPSPAEPSRLVSCLSVLVGPVEGVDEDLSLPCSDSAGAAASAEGEPLCPAAGLS